MNNKTVLGFIVIAIIVVISMTNVRKTTEDKDPVESQEASKIELKEDIPNYNTTEDVEKILDENAESILVNREPYRKLSEEDVNLNAIKEQGIKASNISEGMTNVQEVKSLVTNMVYVDDFINYATENTINEAVNYLINQFESNNLSENLVENLYIAEFLNISIARNFNSLDTQDALVLKFKNLIENHIRIEYKDFNPISKETAEENIETFTHTANKKIEELKK